MSSWFDPKDYDGDEMHQCPIKPFDFHHCYAVVVSGDGINLGGHVLLHTGSGWYFHVAGRKHRPRFLREEGYMNYLRKSGKHEIRRWMIQIPNPAGAHAKLEELLTKQWRWLVLPNNCVAFVEEVVKAGGSSAGMYFNCPAAEPFA
ncbi:hypothetical protein [Massilia horti]|uniref:LRAT domain-containing protein n=1 Tax=Massilia horti TaxID=2562153 RepID=A0A4Y9T2W3_9BURK|nr:hypothetical protein [Massilia horti]TFW34211.1 hypothetical protein E4O92_04605 [Massilia horti]